MNFSPTAMRKLARRLDRINRSVAGVLAAMRHGQALHLHHDRRGPAWWLSGGMRVEDEIAQVVISDRAVVGSGDALPLGCALHSQTWSIPTRPNL
jgi:hypothetical protein